MPKFKCIAVTCNLGNPETDSRLPPGGCNDTRRCKFKSLASLDSSATPPADSSPPPERDTAPSPDTAPPRGPPPTPQTAPRPSTPRNTLPALTAVVAGNTYALTGDVTLGRNGNLAVEDFRKSLSVSREHCRIEASESTWKIVAVSKTAPTSLNGILVSPGDPQPVSRGESTLLLGESFRVILTLRDPEPAEEPAHGELDHLLRDKQF